MKDAASACGGGGGGGGREEGGQRCAPIGPPSPRHRSLLFLAIPSSQSKHRDAQCIQPQARGQQSAAPPPCPTGLSLMLPQRCSSGCFAAGSAAGPAPRRRLPLPATDCRRPLPPPPPPPPLVRAGYTESGQGEGMGQKISRKAGEVSASFASLLSSVVSLTEQSSVLPAIASHRFSQRQPPPQPHIGSNIPPYAMSPAICWLLSYSLI